jgi:hypothetical protein
MIDGSPIDPTAGAAEKLLAEHGVGVVIHNADANVARPVGFASILWRGTVAPSNGTIVDLLVVPPA